MSYTLAADETQWNYSSNVSIDYTEDNMPNIPESGDIRKTGKGTVYLEPAGGTGTDGSFNTADDPTIGGSASTFAGNVYIDAGAIRFGSGSTNYAGNQRVSPDALGSKGTIIVGTSGTLQLAITQDSNVTFNKAVSLNGGKLLFADGSYTFAQALTLTAESTIQGDWSGKTRSFAGLSAEGQTLNITGGQHTYAFGGAVKAATINNTSNSTLEFNGNDSSSSIGTINVGSGTLKLNTYNATLNAQTINIKGGGTIDLRNGNSKGGTFGVSGGAINISDAATSKVTIKGGHSGHNTNIKSNIIGEGAGILDFQQTDATYQNKVTVSGTISGEDLAVVHTSGRYEFTSTNTYGGGTTIRGGKTDAEGSINGIIAAANGALGTGAVTMVGDGKLFVNANKTQTNTVNFNSDDTTTIATLTGATWEGTTLTGTSVAGGTFTGGTLDILSTGLTFSDVTMSGSSITLRDLGATTFTTDVTSSILNGVALTGNTTLALSSDLVATYASKDPFSITFAGLNSENASSITVSQEMVDKFGALTYTKGAEATTLSFAGTGGDAVPEPTTATLSLLALAGLAARRRRK